MSKRATWTKLESEFNIYIIEGSPLNVDEQRRPINSTVKVGYTGINNLKAGMHGTILTCTFADTNVDV